MAVEVNTNQELSFGKPKLLFEKPFRRSDTGINYDVTPDGKRFVVVEGTEEDLGPDQLNVVLDWFSELQPQ
jgi:hypothetical protein